MKATRTAFTLIEVMLAVAVFSFAVVGFGVALNEVLGINAEFLELAEKRQALDAAAARVLAVSNNLVETDWQRLPGWGSEKRWWIVQRTQPVPPFEVPGPNNTRVFLAGWWRVELRVETPGQGRSAGEDRVAVMLWSPR